MNEVEKTPAPYSENTAENAEYLEYYTKFQKYKENRNQTIRFFNKNGVTRNILSYVRDSVDRMNEYHLKPAHKDDWQSNVYDPVTRNKAIAVLSKVASARMAIEILLKYKSIFNTADSKTRATIYKDLLEAANEHNREDEQLIWEMYTGLSEGTVFGEEGIMKDKRNTHFIKSINPDTGEVEWEDRVYDSWDDVYGEIVPIEQLFPETIWVNSRDWKTKVKRIFRARSMSVDAANDKYGRYKNFDKAKPSGYYESLGYNEWGIDKDVCSADNHFILEYFDEVKDEHKIWVSGVKVYDGPIEFNHKRKPYWMAVCEPIHHQFLYGKSLPDKLMSMQDMDNALFNSILDQLFIAVNSPIFISGGCDDLTDGYLEPNRVYHMDSDARIERGGLSNVDQTSFQVLQLLRRSMDESSMPTDQQGVATGGRKTKYEVQTLQENALNIASLFLQLMESAMKDKYTMRLYNVIQYYSQASEAMDGSTRFKFLTLENRRLTNGKTGKKMIQIVPSLDGKTQEQVKQELAGIASQEMGGDEFNPTTSTVEPVVITADYLLNKDVEMEVRVIPNSSIKESSVQKKNNDIAFYQLTNGDPRYNQQMNAMDLADAFGKDPNIVNPESPQQGGGLDGDIQKALSIMGGGQEPKGTEGMPGMEGMAAGTNPENAMLEPL